MRVFVRAAIEDPGYEVANEGLYQRINNSALSTGW